MVAELRLGLIGCGRVAWERHLPALRQAKGFRVVAAADTDAARLAQFDAGQRHTDYRALLSRSDVDAVGILTPTASHAEITLEALAAGKHVLVEKPLALNAAECDRMIERAAVTPVKVVVGLNLRWHRLVRRARELLAGGATGRVTAIRSVYTHERTGENAPDWHRMRATGGGVLLNESIHHFDLWRYLLGAEVVDVFASTKGSSRYEDETSSVTATLTGDVQASGVFAFRTAPNSEVEIFGDNGRLYLNCYRFDGLEFYPRTSFPGDAGIRLRNLVNSLPGGGGFTESFRGLWQHFHDCIRNDEPPGCTLLDGKRATETAAACVRSACEGRPVQL
jgi:UDP-N-acetyl-2-amino-2-deoxyglucuronate dehydrogenase